MGEQLLGGVQNPLAAGLCRYRRIIDHDPEPPMPAALWPDEPEPETAACPGR
jgi:hypothetical protein